MSDDNKKKPDERPKGNAVKKPVKPGVASQNPRDKPAINTVVESKERGKTTDKPRHQKTQKGFSRPTAVFLSVLAALAGGAIGWGGPILLGGQGAETDALKVSLEQTRLDVSSAKIEQKKLADTLAAIQGTSRNQASSNQSIAQSLSALEDEIQKLRDAQPTDPGLALASLEERISKLATLTVQETEDSAVSLDLLGLMERLERLEVGEINQLASRLETLELRAKDIDAKPATFPKPDTVPIELPPEETEQSAQEALNVLITTFPRTKMLETVAAQKAQAAQKPSWLQRTLSRHVKTHDEQVTDPVDTINAAEAALKRGEVSTTLKLMGELNPPVRAIAADWMGAAKKAAKRIEKDL